MGVQFVISLVQDLIIKMVLDKMMALAHVTTTTTKTNTAGEPIAQVVVASLSMSVNSMAKLMPVGIKWLSHCKKSKLNGDKPMTKSTSLWTSSSKNCKKS